MAAPASDLAPTTGTKHTRRVVRRVAGQAYVAPTLERSPEVYHTLAAMDSTGPHGVRMAGEQRA